MAPETQTAPNPKWMTWVGWIVTLLPAPLLVMSAFSKLSRNKQAVDGFAQFGYPADVIVPIGVAEIAGLIVYLIPQTAVLGAIWLTGYLGGAVATHVRAAEYSHAVIPVAMGAVLWLGILLRDPRLRQLLPWRR